MNAITLSTTSAKLVTEAAIAEGNAVKRWRMVGDSLIGDGITSAMIGTPAKPEGLDGKANADVTRAIVAAINASFTKAEQTLLATAPDAIHLGALDLIASNTGIKQDALEKMEKDSLKVQLAAVKTRRNELLRAQSARLHKVRVHLIAEERAQAEEKESGTPRGPKTDGQRIHEMLDRILKMLQKHGEKKDPTWDVVAATTAVRTLMKLIPKI